MKDLIKKLVEAYGPSGYETEVAGIIRQEIAPYVDEIRTDVMGNLIAIKKGQGGRKIMLAAHMDEIGLIVTHIDENGFLRFSNVGGVSPYTLIGERVRFADGTLGVVHHEKLDNIKELKLEKMYIDIGVSSREEAKKMVSVGDMAISHRPMEEAGSRVTAKSLDDRIGCAILIEAARQFSSGQNEVYFVFTVQEEVGTRGAKTAAFGIDPDLGIAVDITGTGDTPEARTMNVSLGKGAAIKVKDATVVTHPKVKKLLTDIAEENGIPYQFEVLEWGGTDAGPIHLTREGVPSGAVSIPCRYAHTASEMVDLEDVNNCVKLLVKVLDTDLAERL